MSLRSFILGGGGVHTRGCFWKLKNTSSLRSNHMLISNHYSKVWHWFMNIVNGYVVLCGLLWLTAAHQNLKLRAVMLCGTWEPFRWRCGDWNLWDRNTELWLSPRIHGVLLAAELCGLPNSSAGWRREWLMAALKLITSSRWIQDPEHMMFCSVSTADGVRNEIKSILLQEEIINGAKFHFPAWSFKLHSG